MRVTNSMMRNNSLLNMQKNKEAYNNYLEQYNTQKKIQRPSDDPTIAVRALKYRTTLAEVEQYLKNIDDAKAWMDQTETSLNDVNSVLSTMQEYFTQAANGTNEAVDRQKIVEQLQEYASYIYEQDANADYSGRYLFTGYRTDLSLLFDKDQNSTQYTITEKLEVNNITKYQYVYGCAEYDASKDATAYASEASKLNATHRIMVSYSNCDEKDKDGNDVVPTVTYTDSAGVEHTVNATVKMIGDNTVYNEHLNPGDNEVYFIPETGELVFGDTIYDSVRNGTNLSVTYEKTNFLENDIRPEHYFDCTATNVATGDSVNYRNPSSQDMNFQINFSQVLTVNTLACNAIDTSVDRKIDDVINICNDIDVTEQNLKSVEKRISDCAETDTTTLANLNELKEQISTQLSMQKTVLTNALSSGITVCQDAQDKLNAALANHGSRYNRMQMTQSKLETQKLNTEEAQSDNEDADLGEAYINFSEADLLYQATLNATNKILGQSLLNFI